MPRAHFDDLAATYEQNAVVQKGAAEVLLQFLQISAAEDVLDVGCGTGHPTRRIRQLTRGRVEGVDASASMVAEARRGGDEAIRFSLSRAEDLAFDSEFDVIFSNSALQWFREPGRALARMRAALRPGGRMGIQAPATQAYCPTFVEAMAHVASHPDTRDTFARFRSPWLFLESAGAYAAVLERSGFAVQFARLQAQRERQPPEGAMRIYESGAVAGYLAQDCYDVALPAGYAGRVREIVRAALAAEADAEGMVDLTFNRVFLVATRR
jgi:trans-aconitate methyltransferase